MRIARSSFVRHDASLLCVPCQNINIRPPNGQNYTRLVCIEEVRYRRPKCCSQWRTTLQITEIEIHAGDVDRPYRTIGEISAKVQAATLFSKTMTIEDVNLKLQEQASRMGANAVIQVQYDRGISLTSYKVLKAKGIAVVLESDEVKCPHCAELIKRQAVKCKHCGSALAIAT